MTIERNCLAFGEEGIRLTTPWSQEARGEILVNGEPVREKWRPDGNGGWACQSGRWGLTVREEDRGIFFLEVRNQGPDPARLDPILFARWAPGAFSPRLPTWEFRELIHGGSFQGMASGVKCVGRKSPQLNFNAPGSMLIAYQRDDRTALLLGVLPPMGPAFSELATLHSEPHLEADFGFEIRHLFECEVGPGASVRTAPVAALSGKGGVELMEEYGDLWQERLGPRRLKPVVQGWNSWDYYSGAVTRADLDENLDAADELFGSTLQVLVIDEGWEQQWGTWEPNAKFGDLEDFCAHVKERGWIPGIWTAPLLVNTYNPLFLERPEWFAARADGQVRIDSYSYGPMAYLDVTRPEVIDHVEGIFRRLRGLGFEYFKVDFCHCILQAERFADPAVGRADLIRRAFSAIRRAIGEEAYLLSCGAPYESVVGLADSARISGDIHIYWGHVLRNAAAFSAHWWMQGKVWNCDPDFLVVRGPDTAEPPFGRRQVVAPAGPEGGWCAGREFCETEARAYALLVHLTGGDVVLSDPLRRLRPNGVEILRRVLDPRPAPAVPVDLFESDQDLPRIWISRGREEALVGLFNWSDKPARIEFDPARYGLEGEPVDFWTGQPASVPERMARRSSVGLRFAT